MADQAKILIADDHSLIRKGLHSLLDEQGNYRIMEVSNGEDALSCIIKMEPDIAILDVDMPKMSGFDVARQVDIQGLNVDIVFLTMHKEEAIFNKAMDIGVKGYVLKENTVTEIMECIQTVLAGKYYLSPVISEFLIRRNQKLAAPAADKKGLNTLTPTEKQVLKLVESMKTSQEMAKEMGVSVKTIQNHRHNICSKLGISGAHALLKFAVENSH